MNNVIDFRNALDPVALQKLAEYMRDGTWLDMRVCGRGALERVQVVNVTVWPGRDDLTLRQETQNGDDVREREFIADAEDVMWARPSVFTDPIDVREVEVPKPQPILPGRIDEVYEATVDAVAFVYSMTRTELDKELSELYNRIGIAVERRYQILWVMREILDQKVSTLEICRRIGYRSPMAYHSAKDKFVGYQGRNVAEWEPRLSGLEAIVRNRL